MIVECHACGASYNISDERVRGRRVRVRCKTCNEAIIIDGTELESGDATGVYSPGFDPVAYGAPRDEETRNMSPGDVDWRQAGGEETRVMSPQVVSPQKVQWREPTTDTSVIPPNQMGFREPGPEDWVVNLSDTDQRTMSLKDIIDAHRHGLLDDAFFWREGMADWRPASEIPELRPVLGLAETYADDMEETTQVVKPIVLRRPLQRSAAGAQAAPAARSYPPPARAPVVAAPRQSDFPRVAPPPRAVTTAAKSGPDLFADVDVESAEDDPLRVSSSLGRYDAKPTGVRNESSVLFSLNTLKATSSAQPAVARTPAAGQTAADILGLSATGALPGMSAAASLLTAPAPEPVAPEPRARARIDTTPPQARKKATPWPLAIGVATIALIAIAAAVFMMRSRGTGRVVERPAELPSAATMPSAAALVESAAPTTPAASVNPVSPEPAQGEPSPASTSIGGSGTVRAPAAAAVATSTTPHSPQRAAATSDVEAMKAALRPEAKPAETSTAKAGERMVLAEDPQEAPPFDAAAAKAALGAAAAQATSCKQEDGPTGKGQVQITFAPTGNTSAATVTDGTFGGTAVGACVAKLFRAAKVPAFNGTPVTVSKSFVIE